MITSAYARTMAAYNRWMNERLYECSARLSDAQRKLDRGAFFRSLHGTLNHILLGDRIWLGRFFGKPYPVRSLDQELYADFEELARERAVTDRIIGDWVESLSDAELEFDMEYTTIANPQLRRHPMWIGVAHFFNHQTHHRGQATTLLFQSGVDPGATDLIWMPGLLTPRY